MKMTNLVALLVAGDKYIFQTTMKLKFQIHSCLQWKELSIFKSADNLVCIKCNSIRHYADDCTVNLMKHLMRTALSNSGVKLKWILYDLSNSSFLNSKRFPTVSSSSWLNLEKMKIHNCVLSKKKKPEQIKKGLYYNPTTRWKAY